MKWDINLIIYFFVDIFVMQDANDLQFRIRGTTPLANLKTEYCNQMSLEPKSIVFLFDEYIIKPLDTPEKVLHKNKIE